MTRCAWAPADDPLYVAYHDEEWGVPERDPRALWEKLMLDGFQAGLAWITVLRKRDAFRAAFKDFDPDGVAKLKEKYVDALLRDAGDRPLILTTDLRHAQQINQAASRALGEFWPRRHHR